MARERPSTHGAIVGEALTAIATSITGKLPEDCCATCAFRPGCMTNQMASTALVAFKCAVGADSSAFACHHGMKDGEPTKVCAGWLASQLVDFDVVKEITGRMAQALSARREGDPDPIREAFDAWIEQVDPTGTLNDYQRGRLYLKSFPAETPTSSPNTSQTPAADSGDGGEG